MHTPESEQFCAMMRDPARASSYLATILSGQDRAGVDWSTLELLPVTILPAERRQSCLDLIYRVRKRGRNRLIFVLVIAGDYDDALVPMLMLECFARIGEWHCRELGTSRFPAVVPVVVRYGREPLPTDRYTDAFAVDVTGPDDAAHN